MGNQKRRARRWRQAVTVVTVVTVWTLAGGGVAAAQISNPLTGVAPDFGLFGTALDSAWKRVVAAIWAAVIIGATVRVIVGAYKVRRAKNRGYAGDLSEGMEDLQDALVSLGLAGLASPIVAAILFVVGG
ncbi:hypothetical protein [Nocardia gipuzkoensis]|uniref:hypothetical protein n=1 Tax=Nocardia gipuzkoensis TaxID=2749991 RepID=UPI00237E96B5|nr:hypothetical protein [Nocardia gipuzkoensis]MDE1672648.1 hypothetical protein [Nocardia gipuzkoensis]